jgi:hypothetical protein
MRHEPPENRRLALRRLMNRPKTGSLRYAG